MALLIATLLVESSGMYCGNDACLLPFLFTMALELYSYCTACAGWNFSRCHVAFFWTSFVVSFLFLGKSCTPLASVNPQTLTLAYMRGSRLRLFANFYGYRIHVRSNSVHMCVCHGSGKISRSPLVQSKATVVTVAIGWISAVVL